MKFIVFLVALFTSGCASVFAPARVLSTDELEAALVALNQLIESGYAMPKDTTTPVAVCLPGNRDPSPAFLQRLVLGPYFPCSSLVDHRPGNVSQISATGQSAYQCFITEATVERGKGTVLVGCKSDALSGTEYTYNLQLINGAWVVTSKTLNWTS